MRKKDILELKRRLKKDDCTFTKMRGCYVDGQKNIVLKLNETFLNLEDDEFFKYLEIAKKTLSGTIGNNLLQLDFPFESEEAKGRQHSLIALNKSALKDDSIIDSFYEMIIDCYDYTGNFLILLFHDAYDVMKKTSDNLKLDESEEVYEYTICAICPVELSKAALGYIEDKNTIGARERDWVVGAPNLGFVFPAFIDRSSDVNSIMYYTKNPKDTHPEIMEEVLGCPSKKTATEQKETFHNIINTATGFDDKKTEELFTEIQENINTKVDEHNTVNGDDSEPIILTHNVMQDILAESGVSEDVSTKIETFYSKEFKDAPPALDHLLDSKVIKQSEQKKKEKSLEKKVEMLQEELKATKKEAAITEIDDENENNNDNNNTDTYNNCDIVVKVNPEKVHEIKSQVIDGKKCIIIPIEENEQAQVNGIETNL